MAKKFLDYDGLEEVVAQVKSLLLGKQDTLTAGDNITISTINNLLTISAEPGIKEITQATNIADMDVGVYKGQSNYFIYNKGNSTPINSSTNLAVVSVVQGDYSSTQYKNYLAIVGEGQATYVYYGYAQSNNGSVDFVNPGQLLERADVVNNLTSTSTTAPLSANQGKVLKDLINEITSGISNASDSDFYLEKNFDTTYGTLQISDGESFLSGQIVDGENRWVVDGYIDSSGEPSVTLTAEVLDENEDLISTNFSLSSSGASYTDSNTDGEGFLINGNPVATRTWTDTQLSEKQDTLTTAQQTAVDSGIDSTLVGKISTNESAISTINGKIPSQASTTNQLADKDFVNSSIQTQTAHFRGNWDTWSDVPTSASSYPADDDGNTTPTSNDYMVVQDSSGYPVGTGEDPLAGTWRFKYSGVWSTNGKNGWLPEYQVNETPLTAAQIAAINSGITSTLVGQITTNQTNIGNKVDKSSTASQVYITNSGGTSTTASQGTAFNKNFETSTTNIKMNGSVSVGSSTNIARADHVHPSDTTRLPTYATDSTAYDTTPTSASTKPITSGGVYTALAGKEDTMTAITTTEIDNLFNS